MDIEAFADANDIVRRRVSDLKEKKIFRVWSCRMLQSNKILKVWVRVPARR